jgi:hypothetical protein
MANAKIGKKVEINTFKNWPNIDIIDYKTREINGKVYVVEIHCKVCARNDRAITCHPSCKGKAKEAMLTYIRGTNFVSKHTLQRHLASKTHLIALEAEKNRPQEDQLNNVDLAVHTTMRQTNIIDVTTESTKQCYTKMFITAYELALQPSMPLTHFKTLVKVQRKNGTKLIEGKDNHRAAAEYIQYLANTIRKKIKSEIGMAPFFSILSDGSQVRKVKIEKELILTRLVKNGKAIYLVTALLEMSR